MADETEAAGQAAPEKKSGLVGTIVNALGILVLVIAGNIATNVIVRDFLPDLAPVAAAAGDAEEGDKKGSAKGKKKEEPKGPPIYLALDPPLVASIDDGEAIRFLQITVEVMARNQATLNAVVTHTPVIRNNLLMLLGRKAISELTSSEGKEQLRQEALDEVRAVLKQMGPVNPDEKLGELEDLYFTSFVVQ